MLCTEVHASVLGEALERTLGRADSGAVAFVRCLSPEVVHALAAEKALAPRSWNVCCVADRDIPDRRTITADHAVELREAKGEATVFLVDTRRAGAGMDGIYNSAQEVDERRLFREALRLIQSELTQRHSRTVKIYAEQAIRKARGFGNRFSISPWTEFDFFVRILTEGRHPGELLHILGLWPIKHDGSMSEGEELALARMFVERLLGTAVASLTPSQRMETLKLHKPSPQQLTNLERFVRSASTEPLLNVLGQLADKPELWINVIRVESTAREIEAIELVPWRTGAQRIARWTGLNDGDQIDDPPVLTLDPAAEKTGNYSKLEVRWKPRPENLERGAVEYRVAIVTDMNEEIASRELPHSGGKEQKCRFTNDDFSVLNDDALIGAKAVVSVVGSDRIDRQESEEFTIRFGQPPEHEPAGLGKKVRALSDGLIELEDRETVATVASSNEPLAVDSKGFVLLRTPQRGKSFRVFQPSLLREVEDQWVASSGAIGRWRVKVRASGARAAAPQFMGTAPEVGSQAGQGVWDRAVSASRRLAERFACVGGAGQVYDEKAKVFETVIKEYVLAWAALLDEGDPSLALCNTVEVLSLSGRTIGLIVLPSHPLRVAWHAAYDNLVLYTAFEEKVSPKEIREQFRFLDGAMFPAFLPGLEGGSPFVFADTLGFHAVGLVPDSDKEPKAAIAILARALGQSETSDTVPTVGTHSARVLGDEILKYIDCHTTSKLLHVHALRPGDGLTVARSLGRVQDQYQETAEDDGNDGQERTAPAFVLELYPSEEQQGLAGRFIAEACEKRRTGAGVLPAEDRWMLESLGLPGGMNVPKLRWARKGGQDPKTPAHLAIAFDTFESRVVADDADHGSRPLFAYGLLSFFEREYTSSPSPLWKARAISCADGPKHPSDRTHTDRLTRLQEVVKRCVARWLGLSVRPPLLMTKISPEKAQNLRDLHGLCDWVITLDRNAGIEYFDSPRDNRDVYDAYVIDCVPEREDLGCLQLITSTSNLEEVRSLLDGALDQMGLSRSRRNAEFLMEHLKALSGRLAIRLTGQRGPTSELIALALSHANCLRAEGGDCWMSLKSGFIVPVDDVLDLIPPLSTRGVDAEQGEDAEIAARPDLIYVSVVPRRGLSFQFVEVKYRRHLRAARGPELLERIQRQVQALRRRWEKWYSIETTGHPVQIVRRAKLARMLRFYADKAHRHYLADERYATLIAEIDRMIERGTEYEFAVAEGLDKGWVFCPEFAEVAPLEISPSGWETRVFLFGPGFLPDSDANAGSPGILLSSSSTESEVSNGKQEGETRSAKAPTVPIEDVATSETLPQSMSGLGPTQPGARHASIVLGTEALSGSEVRWQLTIKGNPHLLVAGLPGMGKTTVLLNLCKGMMGTGIRPIVFSYHEDIDERLQEVVGDIRFVDFHGLSFNPLQIVDRQSPMAYLDVAGSLRDIFSAIYPEIGDIQGERIRKAIKESFVELGWEAGDADAVALAEPQFRRFLDILRADPRPDRGLKTLLGRLEELDDYGFFNVRSSSESLWESDLPTVIRVHTTQNENLQKAFSSLVFYSLYKDMFIRGVQDRITHAVVFDEAHRAAKLRLIPTMAKECRKYGVSLILASQEAKDFNVSLFSAIANYLVLRLNETDAKALVRNVASSDQERALVDRIKQLERFKALYFCEGKRKPTYLALPP